MTENQIRQSVVDTIAAWVGGKRGDAKHAEILATYNGHTPLPRSYKVQVGDAYCATTVSAAWIKAGVESVAVLECSCSRMMELAKAKGIWVEDDKHIPKPGDAVIYDWQDGKDYATNDNKGVPDHVGIVENVDGGVISVIEGNMTPGNYVGRRSLAVNGRYIRGFICPRFAELTVPEKTVAELAREVIAGKWGVGAERKRRLTDAGYDYNAVQAEVNRILQADKPAKPANPIPAKSFAVSVARKYTAKAELTLRCGPGTGYSAIKTLAKGATVRCYGYYTKVDGIRWLYVRATSDGTVGYANERLLSR